MCEEKTMDEDLLGVIREGLIRDAWEFTKYLDSCVEDGDITEEELEDPALVRDMFREYLVS